MQVSSQCISKNSKNNKNSKKDNNRIKIICLFLRGLIIRFLIYVAIVMWRFGMEDGRMILLMCYAARDSNWLNARNYDDLL